MKVCIYARVSTEEQNVAQQTEFLKNWAEKNGHEVVLTVKDEESARIPLVERKKFLKLLRESLNGNYDAVLVFKLDRLTRNWGDVPLVESHFAMNWEKCKLISAYDMINLATAQGRFMFRIGMATNCYEVEVMFERQRIGIARAKVEGKYRGGKRGRRWAN